MSVLCAHCGQPIAGTTPNKDGETFYHGACYSLEFPPEHPGEWPRPVTEDMTYEERWSGTMKPYQGISRYSHDERVQDGLEQP